MRYLTTGEAARICGVGINTIKRWIESGDLAAVVTPGGHKRIPRPEFIRFLKDHAMPVPPELARRRVLIIDDDVEMCAFVRAVLEHAGLDLEMDCAHDGYTGLVRIGAWRPDVLVLDIFMPVFDGLDVLHSLRNNRELPGGMAIVVITSAFDRPDVMRAVRKAGPDAVLPKPVDARQLLAAIRGCLALPAAVSRGVHEPRRNHS